MPLHVPALVSVIIFCLLILAVGIWAARKGRNATKSEDLMVAGRSMGVFVGILSTTATWVGGGYINGTVEAVFLGGDYGGLAWTQAPFGYSLSLLVGAFCFAKTMRSAGYVTMLDPFNNKFGARMAGLLFIPALLGETLWQASILASMGATTTVIVGISFSIATIASAVIAVIYTAIGGLWSVTYTDVVQIFFIYIGLAICAPFAMLWSPLVPPISTTRESWLGTVQVKDIGTYIDSYLLLIFGGIPWQVYFQRVHAAKSADQAKMLSIWASVLCFLICIPCILLGAVANSADWNGTEYGHVPTNESKLTLPLVLQEFTPVPVAVLGLGVVAASVMSSADASLLSASSMFARNIYQLLLRTSASEREVMWVMRLSIVGVAAGATVIAIFVPTVYGLFFLCSDLVYVILFPQLICVLYFRKANTYGSLTAYIVGLTLRLIGGEPLIDLPPAVQYPFFRDGAQLFPFKTLAMVVSFLLLVIVSWVTHWVFLDRGLLSLRYDVFNCFTRDRRVSMQLTKRVSLAKKVDDFDSELRPVVESDLPSFAEADVPKNGIAHELKN